MVYKAREMSYVGRILTGLTMLLTLSGCVESDSSHYQNKILTKTTAAEVNANPERFKGERIQLEHTPYSAVIVKKHVGIQGDSLYFTMGNNDGFVECANNSKLGPSARLCALIQKEINDGDNETITVDGIYTGQALDVYIATVEGRSIKFWYLFSSLAEVCA